MDIIYVLIITIGHSVTNIAAFPSHRACDAAGAVVSHNLGKSAKWVCDPIKLEPDKIEGK